MSKRISKLFSPNTIQVEILQALRNGTLLKRLENSNFYLEDTDNEMRPLSSNHHFAIYELINKSFINKKKSIIVTLPDSEEIIAIDIYAITDKGLNIGHEVKAWLRV